MVLIHCIGKRARESQCVLSAKGGRGLLPTSSQALFLLTMVQLKLRLKTLLDKKRAVQSRGTSTPKISASFITLEEGFEQFGSDLNKLQVPSSGPAQLRALCLRCAAIR